MGKTRTKTKTDRLQEAVSSPNDLDFSQSLQLISILAHCPFRFVSSMFLNQDSLHPTLHRALNPEKGSIGCFLSGTLPSNLFLFWEEKNSTTRHIGFWALFNRKYYESESSCLWYMYSEWLWRHVVTICGSERICAIVGEACCRKHLLSFPSCSHVIKWRDWLIWGPCVLILSGDSR